MPSGSPSSAAAATWAKPCAGFPRTAPEVYVSSARLLAGLSAELLQGIFPILFSKTYTTRRERPPVPRAFRRRSRSYVAASCSNPFHLFLASGPGIFFAAQPLAPVIGVRNGASGTDVLGQVALEARLPLEASFDLCPRFQTVLLPKTSFDRLQSAFELRGSLKTEHGRFFAGVLFNLDQPLGVFSGLNRWGFHLGKEIDL